MQLVRGTHDLIGVNAKKHLHIIDYARKFTEKYGFSEIITPALEFDEIFTHSLGETSDIIRKEMFVLEQKSEDKNQERIILRPEGTAPIMRALFMNGLNQLLPQKFFYAGSMFRYDRPQKGRTRQFHQFGVEFIGVASAWADVEIIVLGFEILTHLKIPNITLEINTLGDQDSRMSYRTALIDYFSDIKHHLSTDSQERLEKNPLRILDSKSPQDKPFIESAPLFENYLNPESHAYFNEVLNHLNLLNIPYKINPKLVRGLDYYCHTIFEIKTEDLGAQGTLLAGGRYDNLSKLIGHTDAIPAVGWAAGIERISMLIPETAIPLSSLHIAIIPLSDEEMDASFLLAQTLRHAEFKVDCIFDGKASQKFKKASRIGANFALIIGTDEILNNTIQIKNLETGQQHEVPRHQLITELKNLSSLK